MVKPFVFLYPFLLVIDQKSYMFSAFFGKYDSNEADLLLCTIKKEENHGTECIIQKNGRRWII